MSEQKYRIWSFEHNAWWKLNSLGYTSNIEEAEIYEKSEAQAICDSANITGEINEEMRLVK